MLILTSLSIGDAYKEGYLCQFKYDKYGPDSPRIDNNCKRVSEWFEEKGLYTEKYNYNFDNIFSDENKGVDKNAGRT